MSVFADPRIIEGSIRSIDRSIDHLRTEAFLTEVGVNYIDNRISQLSADLHSFRKDFDHFVTEHFIPFQASIRSCECGEYFQPPIAEEPSPLWVRPPSYRGRSFTRLGRWSRPPRSSRPSSSPSPITNVTSSPSIPGLATPSSSTSSEGEEEEFRSPEGSEGEEDGSFDNQEGNGEDPITECPPRPGEPSWEVLGGPGVGQDGHRVD